MKYKKNITIFAIIHYTKNTTIKNAAYNRIQHMIYIIQGTTENKIISITRKWHET